MHAPAELRSLLAGDDRVLVIQDGSPTSTRTLAQRADDLSARLDGVSAGRMAVATRRPDVILAALTACHAVGRELLVLRDTDAVDHRTLASWGVGCVLDDDLRETLIGEGEAGSGGTRLLLLTSGTTGTPKLVLHDLDRILGRIRANQADARWLLSYHPASFAGMQVLLTALCSRSQLIATSRQTIGPLVQAALEHRPTHISGTPTFWRSFLVEAAQLAAQLPLRQITLGGEAVDQPTLDRLRAAFPAARISHIYASTEAGALFAVSDGRAGFPAHWLKDGVDGVGLRICGGELEVLSPRAMRSYVTGRQERAQAQGAWMATGDLVEVIGDRVMFRGRLDGLINVGGAKVMPEEVESLLLAVPCVREARVYGVPNPLAGALVAADIVLAGAMPEDAARRDIVQRLSGVLPPHKVPRILRFVADIPVNAVGKKARTP